MSSAPFVLQKVEWPGNIDMHTHAYADMHTYIEVTQ